MKSIKFLMIVMLTMFITNVFALDQVFTNSGFFGKGNKFAIEGYDTVNYFTNGKPIEGSKKYQTEYNGAVWLFSSQEHLDLFKGNPTKYAVQYGGNCVWRLAQDGVGVYGDPNLWTMVDGKVYLNYNEEINSKFKKDVPGFIKSANGYWLETFPTL